MTECLNMVVYRFEICQWDGGYGVLPHFSKKVNTTKQIDWNPKDLTGYECNGYPWKWLSYEIQHYSKHVMGVTNTSFSIRSDNHFLHTGITITPAIQISKVCKKSRHVA